MIIPIDLGDRKIFIDWEEYCRHREQYEKLQIEKLGKVIVDVPEYHGYSLYNIKVNKDK